MTLGNIRPLTQRNICIYSWAGFAAFTPYPPSKATPLQIPSLNLTTTILFRKRIHSEANRIQGVCASGVGGRIREAAMGFIGTKASLWLAVEALLSPYLSKLTCNHICFKRVIHFPPVAFETLHPRHRKLESDFNEPQLECGL